MQGYFIQFLAYTMAMVGFLTVCVFTYKKLCAKALSNSNEDFLYIENGLRINARKQLLVVRAGKERFLIASDAESTTMLAKLEEEEKETQPVPTKRTPVKPIKFNKEDNISSIIKTISSKIKA